VLAAVLRAVTVKAFPLQLQTKFGAVAPVNKINKPKPGVPEDVFGSIRLLVESTERRWPGVYGMQIRLNKADARSQIGGKPREPQCRESVSHVGLIPIVIDIEGRRQDRRRAAYDIKQDDRSSRARVAPRIR